MLSAKHRVRLVCFADKKDSAGLKLSCDIPCDVRALEVDSYDQLWTHRRAMSQRIKEAMDGNDILQCETSFMARFLPKGLDIPSILTMHQIYPLYFWRDFKITKNPASLLRLAKNVLDESLTLNRFRAIVFFSKHDQKILSALVRNSVLTKIIPIGIDLNYFSVPLEERFSFDVCFAGSFANAPNRDAVVYFFSRILPLILKDHPDFSMAVVGVSLPESLRQMWGNKNITFASDVLDVRTYLSASKIVINPMRTGSGMRTKILEAWAMAKAVVSTHAGCEGIEAVDGKNILIADSPVDFANQITRLLKDVGLRRLLEQEGHASVQLHHNRIQTTEKLGELYREILTS
ncbi:MAG: glycosyltransferase family 4 protein [Candidatus Omnitrophota bacterium]